MELLLVGDLHLPSANGTGGLSKYVEHPEQMVLRELHKVTEYALSKHVVDIVLAGDLCNGPRMNYEANLAFDDFLTSHSDFRWHIYPGNHDMYGPDPALGHSLQLLARMQSTNPMVRIYTKPTKVKIQNVHARFLPWPHSNLKSGCINFFHNEVRGALSDSGREFTDDELSDSDAVACSGHLHTAHQVRNTHYCGTLYQTNFGERLPKFFTHVEYNSDSDFQFTRVPHDPEYKLYNVVIESRQDLASIPEGEKNLVKLVVADGADISASDLTSWPNIVETRNFKTKQDLAQVLNEESANGQAVAFKVSSFFNAWIESYDVPDQMRDRIKVIRKRVLNNAKDAS